MTAIVPTHVTRSAATWWRPQRRQVPLSETQQVVDLLNDYMTTMTACPMTKRPTPIGQDMYDVMRQYITENFNMHLRCLLGAVPAPQNCEKSAQDL